MVDFRLMEKESRIGIVNAVRNIRNKIKAYMAPKEGLAKVRWENRELTEELVGHLREKTPNGSSSLDLPKNWWIRASIETDNKGDKFSLLIRNKEDDEIKIPKGFPKHLIVFGAGSLLQRNRGFYALADLKGNIKEINLSGNPNQPYDLLRKRRHVAGMIYEAPVSKEEFSQYQKEFNRALVFAKNAFILKKLAPWA